MPTAEEVTDPLAATYTRVLPAGPGVCGICHGQPNGDYPVCFWCNHNRQTLTASVDLVVPISLATPDSQFHRSMKYYKEPVVTAPAYQTQLAALLARFMTAHAQCIIDAAGADWDTVTIVPSSKGRHPHPVERVVLRSRLLEPAYRSLLAPGPTPIDHNQPADDGYVVTEDVSGRKILLVDDTFTSGARSQSAASALQLAGARVIAIVPIERHVKREYSAELIERAKAKPFRFDVCCLEPQDV